MLQDLEVTVEASGRSCALNEREGVCVRGCELKNRVSCSVMGTVLKAGRRVSQRNFAFHGPGWIIPHMCESGCTDV